MLGPEASSPEIWSCEPFISQTTEANSGLTGTAPLWSSESSPAAQQSLRTWTRLNSQNRSTHATSRSTTSSLEPPLPCRAFSSIPSHAFKHFHAFSALHVLLVKKKEKRRKKEKRKEKIDQGHIHYNHSPMMKSEVLACSGKSLLYLT